METPTLQDRLAVSWSLSMHWARRVSLGRRKSSPSMPLHCHGIGQNRGHLLLHSMIDKRVGRTRTQWDQSKWDPELSRMGQGEPCTPSNGRRKCARNDDSAVTFIRWFTWKTIYLTTHVLEKINHGQSCGRKKSLTRTRRTKKLKRR